MAVTAPEHPRRAPEVDDPERLEALIKEARRRARLRRLRYATCGVLVAAAGAAAVLGPGGGGGAVGPAAPEPASATAPWEIKLAGPRLAYVPKGLAYVPKGGIGYVPTRGRVLYVTKPDGSGSRPLAACPRTPKTVCELTNPVWSPDGRRIAFLRGRPTSPNRAGDQPLYVVGDQALYVVDLDGRERRLADCGGCGTWTNGSRLAWSPDGSQIAFTRGGTLSIIDVESAHVRRLTRCEHPPCLDVDPAWSPDQTAIAFTRRPGHGSVFGVLYRVNTSGRQLTKLAYRALNPVWAPDGRTILVSTLFRQEIVSVAAEGFDPNSTPLISDVLGGAPSRPSWSPDGSRLLYFRAVYERTGMRAEVWTMKPNGTEKKRLYRGSCCLGYSSRPVWSADGTRVALSAGHRPIYSPKGGGTFVVGADGTKLRTLTRLTAELAWQPTPASTNETHR